MMLAGINPLLQKQGLTLDFSDDIVQIGTRYYIKTTLTVHDTEDGEKYQVTEFAREQEQKKGMDEAQITGSTMTYAHKYALMSMFAISDPKMDPDSMDNSNDKQQAPAQPQAQRQQAYGQPAQRTQQTQQTQKQPAYQVPQEYWSDGTPMPPAPMAAGLGGPQPQVQQTTEKHQYNPKGDWNWGYSPAKY